MKDYPSRHITHTIEKHAIDVLNRQLPKEWIVREVTERDYGIDLYIEIVGKDKKVTGDLIAIQLKGKEKLNFSEDDTFTFYSIKMSTMNYWLGLPVPVFLVVVCLDSEVGYWQNIREGNRNGKFIPGKSTLNIKIPKKQNLKNIGLIHFQHNYIREKRWPEIETAMKASLMFYNSLGPFMLICKRKPADEYCSSTVQYILTQHFEYYRLLTRYILGKKPSLITKWYDKHIELEKKRSANSTLTFSYGLINEMLRDFVGDYRESIRIVNFMVIKQFSKYYSERFPFLYMHLKLRPLTFVETDWYARYYHDEYENETLNIEKKYFEDFTEYDNYDLINDLKM